MLFILFIVSLAIVNGFISSNRLPRYISKSNTRSQLTMKSVTGIEEVEVNINKFEGAEEDSDYDIYTQPLIDDIARLSGFLSDIVQTESKPIHDHYETLKAFALARSNGDQDALNKMTKYVENISAEDALGVTRAFTQTLNLINAAEVHHRMRYLRTLDFKNNVLTPLPMREDSVSGAIDNILNGRLNKGATVPTTPEELERKKQEIYEKFLNVKVEIVYTAHPTEVNRRTMLRKYRHVSETLATLDRKDLSPYERQTAGMILINIFL